MKNNPAFRKARNSLNLKMKELQTEIELAEGKALAQGSVISASQAPMPLDTMHLRPLYPFDICLSCTCRSRVLSVCKFCSEISNIIVLFLPFLLWTLFLTLFLCSFDSVTVPLESKKQQGEGADS